MNTRTAMFSLYIAAIVKSAMVHPANALLLTLDDFQGNWIKVMDTSDEMPGDGVVHFQGSFADVDALTVTGRGRPALAGADPDLPSIELNFSGVSGGPAILKIVLTDDDLSMDVAERGPVALFQLAGTSSGTFEANSQISVNDGDHILLSSFDSLGLAVFDFSELSAVPLMPGDTFELRVEVIFEHFAGGGTSEAALASTVASLPASVLLLLPWLVAFAVFGARPRRRTG